MTMKHEGITRNLASLTVGLALIASLDACKEKNPAEPIHDEEHSPITTIELRLSPVSGDSLPRSILLRDTTQTNQRPAVVGSPLNLRAGAQYDGTIWLWNEAVSPAVDVSDLIDSESTSHKFSYNAGGGLSSRVTFSALSPDASGKEYGRAFRLTVAPGQGTSGTITVRLYHYASGNKNDYPEIDREATFETIID